VQRPTTNKKARIKQRSYEYKIANERGVFAVRRLVSPESYDALRQTTELLSNELKNIGRTFEVETIGVTIVGFSRFFRKHMLNGPATSLMTENVRSAQYPIEVVLGRLGIYGPDSRAKLAVSLDSFELVNEELAYRKVYEESGYALNNRWSYQPHCSLALIASDYVEHFTDPRSISKLNKLTGLGKMIEQSIILEPVRVNS